VVYDGERKRLIGVCVVASQHGGSCLDSDVYGHGYGSRIDILVGILYHTGITEDTFGPWTHPLVMMTASW
jgi:hypothetical protein